MEKKNSKYEAIKDTAGILAAIAGILAFIQAFFGLGIFSNLFQLIVQRPEWFWYRGFLIYFSFIVASFVSAWLWYPQLLSYFYNIYRSQRFYLVLKMFSSFIILIPFTLLLTFVMFQDRLPTQEGKKLFPQAADFGPIFIRNYATNGVVHHKFIEKIVPFGPKDGFTKIIFKLYGFALEQNAGWVIYLLRGVDLSKYHELRFLIQGEEGKEKIGIKAKDVRGVEVQLPLEGNYLRKGEITTEWQEAIIPLSHFGNVDFSLMENFSIFTTGVMAGTRPQTIYLGEFRLK